MQKTCVPNAIYGLPGKPANGGSCPRFYDFDDGVVRLVKWHPCVHGAKACYNELLASRLGQLIAAPILRGSVIFVPDDVIPPDHRAEGAAEGFHFAVARMPGQNFIPDHYKDIQNNSELPRSAAFLAWLNVADQDGHNQFLRLEYASDGTTVKSKRFMLIDMGAAFGNWNWTEASVAASHDSYALPTHMLDKVSLADLDAAVSAIHAIDGKDISESLLDVPAEWGITQADCLAVIRRVEGTRPVLMDIIRKGNPSLK